ncbi:MAG: hypothetical protein WDN72_05145 [Alphaproteobacteria bacterium]
MAEDSSGPASTPPKPPGPPPMRHPGALWKGKRTDELDVPPTPLIPPKK